MIRTTDIRSFASPGKYIQGTKLLKEIKHFTDKYGVFPIFIIDSFIFDSIVKTLKAAYPEIESPVCYSAEKEITAESISAMEKKIGAKIPDVYVAIGGGKTIDTVKILANNAKKPVIVVPSSASTDAPCSGLSVVYKANGEHSHEVWLDSNPDLVLVDSQIIAEAPTRLLVSGMGDALATYFEARANELSRFDNIVGLELGMSMGPSLAGKAIAKLCYDVLLLDGAKAKIAAEANIVTEALENIIEVNTLLSGLGFENNGTAAAHAINDGLTVIPHIAKNFYHGERVAFGVLCELVMEHADNDVLNEVYGFCLSVGLPITLEDLDLPKISTEQLTAIVDVTYDNVVHAEPLLITKEVIANSILVADQYGRAFKNGKRF